MSMGDATVPQAPPASLPALARVRAWWAAEARATLAGLRPDPLASPRASLVVLRPAGTDVEIVCLNRGKAGTPVSMPVASFAAGGMAAALRRVRAPRGAAVVIEPPPAMVLSHRIPLPAAATEAAPSLVADVVRRKTPLSPERFHAAHACEPDPAGTGKATLRIALVPRDWMEMQLARLGLDVRQVAAVMVRPSGEAALFARLAPARRSMAGVMLKTLAAVAVAGAAGLAGWAAWDLHQRGEDLDRRLEAIGPQAREAMARARSAGDARALVEALGERRAKAGPLVVWRELTRVVPDDTWIVELQLGERDVSLSGFSTSAAALIPLIEASPLFREASFAGAVVYDPQEKRERFTIRAALRHPQPAPETLP
ncbi:PilN domain-containing protein [Alsobacter sp. R-9]